MAYSVLVPNQIMAKNVDSLNRSAVCASNVENGNLLVLASKSATAGESEVWTATVPSTSAGLTGLWMAYEPEVVVTVSGSSQYKGLDPNPQNFINLAGDVFSAFKPQLGDIVQITADGLSGTYIAGTTTHVNAVDTTGGLQPVWGNSQTASVFSMKLLAVQNLPLATGAIDTQRITAYQFEVVGL